MNYSTGLVLCMLHIQHKKPVCYINTMQMSKYENIQPHPLTLTLPYRNMDRKVGNTNPFCLLTIVVFLFLKPGGKHEYSSCHFHLVILT